MKYTIAVNSYQHPEMLARCLRYIQDAIKDLDAEIIVADSETGEETVMMMREDFPEVRFFPNTRNIGMGALANIGLYESFGEFIFFINYDCIINKEAIVHLVERLENDITIGLTAPQVKNYDGTLQYTCFRFYHPLTVLYRRTPLGKFSFAKKHIDNFLMKDADHNTSLEPDWVMGSAMMMRKKDGITFGGFDSRFFMYFEDTDLCRKCWENEKRVVYVPEAKIYHLHGKGSARGGLIRSLLFNKLTWIHIISACKYFLKYYGKPNPRGKYSNSQK